MQKAALAAFAALVVGVVAGVFGVQAKYDSQMAEMDTSMAHTAKDFDHTRRALIEEQERVAAMQAELYDLENERANLLAQLREQGAQYASPVDEFDAGALDPEFFAEPFDDAAMVNDDEDNGRQRRRWDENSPEAQERRAQMEDFRRQMDETLEQEIGSLGPEYANHFAALSENRAYQEELRGQLRDTETDEEREALFQEMRAASESSRQLMDEVQRGMMREFAKAHGGGEDVKTADYVRDLRALMDNPVFRMEGMYTGGFGGPRGGGFGGGIGGGRRGGPPPGFVSGERGASGR